MFIHRLEPKKDDKPKVSYSIFSYLEASVHDKDSFAKEQSQFSGSKSVREISETVPKPTQNVNLTDNNTGSTVKNFDTSNVQKNAGSFTNEGSFKRMTVAELFLKESEKNKEKGQAVTETIDKFDKMDLYKSIFLSDSEEETNEEDSANKNEKTSTVDDFVEAPKNLQRNTSPPRGIFANIDFDELNSWRRNIDKADSSQEKSNTDKKSNSTVKEKDNIDSMDVDEVYGPKIPETIQKRLQSNDRSEKEIDSKNESNRDVLGKIDTKRDVVEVDSSSSESWVDAKEVIDKKKKKKSKHKKQKSKHKKSKHKKKDK